MNWKGYFKDKRITVVGLGLNGGSLNDIIFLAKHGATITVTDLKTAEDLKPSMDALKEFDNISYVLGEHRLEDFSNTDLILQPGNIPPDSLYLAEATKHHVPIYVSESLFAYCAPEIQIVGITGTRGKSTITHMIYDIVSQWDGLSGQVFLGGNVRNVSTLSLLEKIKEGDIIVLELDSWALHGMGDIQKSPHIAVFSTFMSDHLNFYKGDLSAYLRDKANIFLYQDSKDTLVFGEQCARMVKEAYGDRIKSRTITVGADELPESWELRVPGVHNRYNAALALAAVRTIGVPDEVTKARLEVFAGVPGRLELVDTKHGVRFYNDTTATTPDALVAALEALDPEGKKNILLIAGGADKGLDAIKARDVVHAHAKQVFFLAGTGTDRVKGPEDVAYTSMRDAVAAAYAAAAAGDIVLLSPGFASFGMFANEFDRGDQFVQSVRSLG